MSSSTRTLLTQLKALGVKHLSLDSRRLDKSTAFVAIQGTQHHGIEFIDQAIEAGVPCVLVGDHLTQNENLKKIPFIEVPNLNEYLGDFASAFYGYPSRRLKIHAITGTNGKTSCSQFIAQALMLLGEKCAVIGTLGMGVWPDLKEIPNTTPDAISLQGFLADCVVQGVQHVSIEASSIALVQGRMQGCEIYSAIFTNLTQDHLDFHGSMESYAEAKHKLFDFPGLQHAIINADDALGEKLLSFRVNTQDFSFSAGKKDQDSLHSHHIIVLSSCFTAAGISARVQTSQGVGTLKSPLLGYFNLENLLAVFTWMLAQSVPLAQALTIIPKLKNPKGRMEVVNNSDFEKPLVMIDYAHTPDALEKVLKALRSHCEGELWCVFGCGGNRDKTKRPLMGKITVELADHVVITSDNPRNEDPKKIIEEIQGKCVSKRVNCILDRTQAIEYAIKNAKHDDIILIAGKGHENYQEIKGKKLFFDDAEVAKRLLKKLRV